MWRTEQTFLASSGSVGGESKMERGRIGSEKGESQGRYTIYTDQRDGGYYLKAERHSFWGKSIG